MQFLAFKDPTGQVHIMDESDTVPPLAEGYEWTLVVRPDDVMSDEAPSAEPQPPKRSQRSRGFLDVMIPLLTPRADQSPQERAKELLDAIPEDVRGKLAQLVKAIAPPKPAQLPAFPGARQ